MRRRLLPLLVLATATLGTLFVAPAHAHTAYISVVMTGDQEAPNPGDPDGVGSAFFILDSDTGRVCVRFHVQRIAPATAAHIHIAPRGVAGPIVVHLPAPTSGFASGCVTASPGRVHDIMENPHLYYVNVHNQPFPGGAVRGQLG